MGTTVTEIMELADMHAYAQIADGTPARMLPRNLLQSKVEALIDLHTENEQLRTGYAAARLEIASLQAQLESIGAGGVSALMPESWRPAAPDGWKLVPTGRATGAMVLAASRCTQPDTTSYSDLWMAMVAAAPQAAALPAQEPLTGAQVRHILEKLGEYEATCEPAVSVAESILAFVRGIEAAHGITSKAEGAQP